MRSEIRRATLEPSGMVEQRAIRVLHLTAVEAPNYYLNTLADILHPNRVTLFAVTLGRNGGFTEELRRRGIDARAHGTLGRRLLFPLAALRIGAFAAQASIQIIHSHLFEPSLLGALISSVTRRKLVLTRHHSDAVHRIEGTSRRQGYLLLESYVSRKASHIIAPAQRVQAVLTEMEGVPAHKITVIPYPQDKARFKHLRAPAQVRAELGAGEARVLVTVCRLHPEKGLPVLLRALAELPSDIRLFVVGTGPDRESLEHLASALGVQNRVAFLGWRPDALEILGAADLVVHPSLHEALPSAVIEALALGRPIVATDVSGIRDILGQAEYGTIVAPGDARALSAGIAGTLADLAGARTRAALGRTRLFSYMEPHRVADAHLQCYRSVLS